MTSVLRSAVERDTTFMRRVIADLEDGKRITLSRCMVHLLKEILSETELQVVVGRQFMDGYPGKWYIRKR